MNDRCSINRSALGWLFLVGQFFAVGGSVVGLIGFAWNFLAVMFGLVICSSGLALARYSRIRLERNFEVHHTAAERSAVTAVTRWLRLSARISVGVAIACVGLLFVKKPRTFNDMWLLYGLVGSVMVYVVSIAVGSGYVAWSEFFNAQKRVP